MTDFYERAIVADQLQTIYQPPETTSLFSDLLDRIEAGTTEKIVQVKRKSVWWFK